MSLPRLRALVVDDDPTMVEFVTRTLARAGFAVETAADGLSALEMFRKDPYDAVVIDLRMPKLSGISFLLNLRLKPNSPHRVVMLTSLDDAKVRREALDAGAVAFLVKPATSRQILDALLRVTG
ncbi:MAG TPA: response regulator [Usitatibacteraceae bacterium]|nr:response regulator [Usitatibacteraceae bacterium]